MLVLSTIDNTKSLVYNISRNANSDCCDTKTDLLATSRSVLWLFIFSAAVTRATLRVRAADAFYALFLLCAKIEAHCADDDGDYCD